MPLEQPESDQQVTGSTFVGNPTVIAGVYFGSGNVGSLPAYVQTFLLDPSGALYITTSGSVSVASPPGMLWPAGPTQIFTSGPQAVSGTIGINNFPATQNVSGNVGAVIQNWPATMGISASAVLPVAINNWPATIGVTGSTALRVWDGGIQGITASAPLQVYSSGTLGVSGTVSVNNFPATQNVSGTVTSIIGNWPAIHGVSSSSPSGFWMTGNVPISGSQLTGSTFAGFPVVVGGAYNAGTGPAPTQYVTALKTDVSGAIYVTVSGSIPVSIANITITSGALGVAGTVASGSSVVDPPVFVGGADTTGIIRAIQTDTFGRIVVAPAGTNQTNGIAYGTVTTSATTNVPLRASTYTEQTGSATRSIASSNANDTLAGTGVRKVIITYYAADFSGPFTETIALSGTTGNNTVNSNICFVEKIIATQVGSGGVSAGAISLYQGINKTGNIFAALNTGDNQTFWAHHYVPSGKTTYVTSYYGNNNNGSNNTVFSLTGQASGSASPLIDLADSQTGGGGGSPIARPFGTPVTYAGPGRIVMYGAPAGTPTIISRGSFDFYDQ